MNTIRFTNRQTFIDALEERRAFWRAYDQRQEKEHKAAEQQWLKDTRARMREALKWDYEEFQRHYRKYYGLKFSDLPRCPKLMEPRLDHIIACLKRTMGNTFSVDSQGTWSEAHSLLTWDPDAKTSVC